jgi:hypothetical protein
MVDEKVLTVFLAMTAVAVLIQTGLLVGFYFISTKLSRQVDQAMNTTRNILEPLQNTAESLQIVAVRLAEVSSNAQGHLRHLEEWWRRRAA